jgi:hypothetical protein
MSKTENTQKCVLLNHCREAFVSFPNSAVHESLRDEKSVHLLVDHDIALLLRRLRLLGSSI